MCYARNIVFSQLAPSEVVCRYIEQKRIHYQMPGYTGWQHGTALRSSNPLQHASTASLSPMTMGDVSSRRTCDDPAGYYV